MSDKVIVSADVSPLELMAAAAIVSGRPSRTETEVPLDSLPRNHSRRGAVEADVFRVLVALLQNRELAARSPRLVERLHLASVFAVTGCRTPPPSRVVLRREYRCSVLP